MGKEHIEFSYNGGFSSSKIGSDYIHNYYMGGS